MPDVLVMDDGTRVTTPRQWQARRQEMRRILSYYAVGQMPPPPGNVKGREIRSELVLDGTVKYRLVRLTFGPRSGLSLDIGVFTPARGRSVPRGDPPGRDAAWRGGAAAPPAGPEPGARRERAPARGARASRADGLDVRGAGRGGGRGARTACRRPPRRWPTERAELFTRGYALVLFNPNDCAEDTTLRNMDGSWAFRNTRFFPAYPGYDWGILAGWAWGASRVADYLEHDAAIDARALIITGASRNGKSAMIAAAFDDRLMGAPVVTGGGGVGAYRFAGPRGSETLDIMETKYPNWFSPNLHQFRGQREKLPFDQHWFLALAAPRPFIALEGDADRISLPEAVRQSMLGARPAYALLGAEDRLGVNFAHHGHAFTPDDWTAMLDFFDKHLRGKPTERTFDRFPTEQELDAARQ